MQNLIYRTEDGIGHLSLNRPDHYNAFEGTMIDEFEAFWHDRRYDDGVRVIILDGGAAKGFCAGLASSYFLPRLIGSGRANEFLLTGNWMSAEDAMQLGFASRLVPKEKLAETAGELARVMAGKTPLALRMTKEAINVNMDAGGLEACLHMEDRNQMMILYSLKLSSPPAKA